MADSNSQKMAAIGAKQDIEIELATRPALRLWQGREKTQKRHGILGLPGFCKEFFRFLGIIMNPSNS